jgi:teichuronic acid biosynthesis glycosyltransferase TuaC
MAMTELLVITSLYPNNVEARHGIFVETRLRHLISDGDVTATVVAPVPWFPFKSTAFPEYSRYVDVHAQEYRNGLAIYHPRYIVVPKIGMLLTPFFMAISIGLAVLKLRRGGMTYDVVDTHYYYPDGVAVAMIARFLAKPFVITARGTDINLIPQSAVPRRLILWAARRAAASITVCKALKDRMVELGAQPEKIEVLRNGVDLELFHPMETTEFSNKYPLSTTTLLSVGHLIERKGHDLVIESLLQLPDASLLIAGDGPQESNLKALVKEHGLGDRVTFLGAVDHGELVEIYNAVDIMVLASSREGWANVLLEAMACGTPVVATSIWGTPEVVADSAAGVLVSERSASGLAEGVRRLLENFPSSAETRLYAERFSWGDTVAGIKSLLREVQSTAKQKVGRV